MKGVRAAVWCTLLLVLLSASSMWVSTSALARMRPGVELALHWRIGLALSNLHTRYSPFLTIGVVALAATIGTLLERKWSISKERRALGAWLLLAAAVVAAEAVTEHSMGSGARGFVLGAFWMRIVGPILYAGLVAFVAAGIVAVPLQSRLHELGSRVRGWHVAVATCVLLPLGPVAGLPPLAVWLHAGRVERRRRRAAGQGSALATRA